MAYEDHREHSPRQSLNFVRLEESQSCSTAAAGGPVQLRCTPSANVGHLVYDRNSIAEHPQHAGSDNGFQMEHGSTALQSVTHRARQPDRSHRAADESDFVHVNYGPLGAVPVVADAYVGPMPQNAIRESDYRRMIRIVERIDSGESSIQFDVSNFLGGEGGSPLVLTDGVAHVKADAEAAKFKQQYVGYIRELVKTPAGLQLLTQLDGSHHKTTIKHNTARNGVDPKNNEAGHVSPEGVPGAGTEVTVFAAPNLTEWTAELCHLGKQQWMNDRPKFAFFHELVHAYHLNRGDNELDAHGHAQCMIHYPRRIAKMEFQAVGLGPYAADAVSENAIRAQMGVPLRPTYSGATWEGSDIWGYKGDAEDPSSPGPSR